MLTDETPVASDSGGSWWRLRMYHLALACIAVNLGAQLAKGTGPTRQDSIQNWPQHSIYIPIAAGIAAAFAIATDRYLLKLIRTHPNLRIKEMIDSISAFIAAAAIYFLPR